LAQLWGFKVSEKPSMICGEESAFMGYGPTYAYQPIVVSRLEPVFPSMPGPSVLSTQPAKLPPCYVAHNPMPYQAQVQAYPYVIPPPPPPYPQPLQQQMQMQACNQCSEPKHQLLLDQFLKPPREASHEEREGYDKPEHGQKCSTKKVLMPGLVSTDSDDLSPQGLRDAENVANLFIEDKTTVMLRNIPNRYTCEELLSEVMIAGFDRKFDFFYLPMDFKTKRNRGYGFINFNSASVAQQFVLAFHRRQLKLYSSKKILEVAPAVTQGYHANMSKYFEKDSERIKNDWFRPMLFNTEAFE